MKNEYRRPGTIAEVARTPAEAAIGRSGPTATGVQGRSALNRIVTRPKLGAEVAKQIRDAIMSGVLRPGQRLVLADLASNMGVSGMPVREALVSLAHEGVVEMLPRRGYAVARIEKRDVEDVFIVHAFVAGVIAERAAGVIKSSDVERLRKLQEQVNQVAKQPNIEERSSRIEELNYTFHRTINRLVTASRMLWFLRASYRYVPRHVYERVPGLTDLTITDHPAIIAALEDHDARTARERVSDHVLRAGEKVVQHLTEQGFLS